MLGVLFIFYFIAYLDRYSLTVLVEPIAADLGLTDFQMSIILGPAFSFFYAIFGLPLGLASDRFDRRWILFLGVAAWSCATVATAFANDFTTLLLVRMFIAIGEASLVPAAYSLLGDAFHKGRLTTAMAIFSTGQKAGLAASFILAALAIVAAGHLHTLFPQTAAFAPWQLAFVFIGAPGIALAFLAFSFAEPPRQGGGGANRSVRDTRLFAWLKGNRGLSLPLALAIVPVAMTASGLASWSPTYLGRHFGWTPIQYGPAMSIIATLAIFAVVAKGWVMDWLFAHGMKDAHVRFYTWMLATGIPVAVVAFMLPSGWMFLLALGYLQILVVPYMVYFAAALHLMAPGELRGGLIGLYFGLAALSGNGFGPPVIGALTDFVFRDPAKLGWSIAILTVSGLVLTMISLRVLLLRLRPAIEERERMAASS